MSCSFCGKSGHNARSCPWKATSEARDYAVVFKVDMITEHEASKLQAELLRTKDKVLPHGGRGTSIKGKVSDIPLMLHPGVQTEQLRSSNG